ncbi:MAG: efflux RND transporter periplasmic adaptor subunit, partial [Bacteroidota bacterium]
MANNNKKKSKKRLFIFSGMGVVLIVLVLLVVLGSKRESIITVQTEKVAKRTITQVVSASGKIQPEVLVNISPEVAGEIIELPVKMGQRVKKGDLLLRIKPDTYMAARDQSKALLNSSLAGLELAKANFDKAVSDYRRSVDLHKKGLLSDAELEAVKTTHDVARAQYNSEQHRVEQTRASLNQAEENLRKTTIYAPMEGTISQLISKLGERVVGTGLMAGTIVMSVADLTRMEARVDVDENDVVRVSAGDTARIEVDAYPNRKFIGVVYEIANTAKTKGLGTQEELTNFEVKIRILDKDVAFRPGMSVTADIETSTHHDVLAVPIQSVTTRMPKEPEKQESQADQPAVTTKTTAKKKIENKVQEVVFVAENGKAKTVNVKRG